MPYFVRVMPGFRKLRAGVRGRDVAGRVEAVGGNVRDFRPGDEVLGVVEGSFAELAVGRPRQLVPKPARLTFEQAAAAPISGLTALQAIRDVAKVRPGQRVLVIGAGGGVGTLTVQVAKAFGAEVTGVCSTSKVDLVRSIGADRRHRLHARGLHRRHAALGRDRRHRRSSVAARARRALDPDGTLVIVGGDGGGRWTGGFFRQILRAPLMSLFVGQKLRPLVSTEKLEDLQALAEIIEAGKVTPVVGRTYALIDAAEAIRHLERDTPPARSSSRSSGVRTGPTYRAPS